ncbi:MAG: CoA-binding protein [Ponticaulis sp.]|nr:CoA-binding protein [Ponticaulis sp.]|tara:strand:+ start:10614 stop:12713 length:2100 start_codon:yes stop_codon:yes gene_type:complete
MSIELNRLLSPKSVVIVGASPTPGALGASVLANLERGGFQGEIHLVNPKRDNINGRPCANSIGDLPNNIDAAVLAIPQAGVIPALRDLAKKNIGGAVIFSAGFAEGGEDGLAEQAELAEIAETNGIAVEGPNCLGFVNNRDGVALTFVQTPAATLGDGDGVAIVSQSGAMAAVLGVTLASKDIAVTLSVSTGNEAATGVQDYVEYLIDDPRTKVIAMIVEQFRKPAEFLELAKKARAAGKPIVLLHPGKSEAARESAATHTGAMAGDYTVMRTLVERAGVVVADSLEQLGDLTDLYYRAPAFDERGTVILTESGAFKAISLDLAEDVSLGLPAMSDDDSPAMREALPDFVPVSNPVDLTAQALVDPSLYKRSIAALLGDDRVGAVLLGIIQTDANTATAKLPHIIEAVSEIKPDKPVVYAGLDEGAEVPESFITQLRELGVSCYPTAERAIASMAKMTTAAARASSVAETSANVTVTLPEKGGVVPEYLAKDILRSAGLTFPDGKLATSKEEAVAAANSLGFPVVMKAQSAALSHKSDAGGVILNLNSDDAVAEAFETMYQNIERYSPGMKLDGVLIETMSTKGVELILGAKRDPQWGPVILIGFGGVQAEVIKDFRILPSDLSTAEIEAEILLLKGAALLTGFRGSKPVDLEPVVSAIAAMSALMRSEPRIREIDLNPVIARPKGEGFDALDALILVD